MIFNYFLYANSVNNKVLMFYLQCISSDLYTGTWYFNFNTFIPTH